MLTLFEQIMIGHLIGDYLLQPKEMAIRKSEKGWCGLLWCLFHCLIYTAAICITTQTFRPLFIVLIFLSHFPVDRWSLGYLWLKIIKGRDFEGREEGLRERTISLSFSAVVYTVVDNTIHLLLLILVFNLKLVI